MQCIATVIASNSSIIILNFISDIPCYKLSSQAAAMSFFPTMQVCTIYMRRCIRDAVRHKERDHTRSSVGVFLFPTEDAMASVVSNGLTALNRDDSISYTQRPNAQLLNSPVPQQLQLPFPPKQSTSSYFQHTAGRHWHCMSHTEMQYPRMARKKEQNVTNCMNTSNESSLGFLRCHLPAHTTFHSPLLKNLNLCKPPKRTQKPNNLRKTTKSGSQTSKCSHNVQPYTECNAKEPGLGCSTAAARNGI